MTTTKTHTTIEQSRKLAKILPLESADMCFANDGTAIKIDANSYNVRKQMWKDCVVEIIPCWSLAVLVDILPRSIEFKDDKYYLRFMKDYVEYANDEVSITGRCLHTTGNNNLVDASYEMILKLNELNLL